MSMLFYFMLGAGQSQRPATRKKAGKHTTHNRTKPRLSLDIGPSFCFWRITATTATSGHRVRTELSPTGPAVFCGNASHSLPLLVCNMITHRRWCFASCLPRLKHTTNKLSQDSAGEPCECDGRHCGLFDEPVSTTHEHGLQGSPLHGARRRQVDRVRRQVFRAARSLGLWHV